MTAPHLPTGIDFTAEELAALCEGLGLPGVPGLDVSRVSRLSESARILALNVARTDLIARGILRISDSKLEPTEEVARLLAATTRPTLLGLALNEVGGRVTRRFYAASPLLAAELRWSPLDICSIEAFEQAQFVDRMVGFVELEDRAPADVSGFDITPAALFGLSTRLAARDEDGLTRGLREAGVSVASAEAFALALLTKVRSAEVAVIYRPTETSFMGSTVTWMDSGPHGLWLTPTPEGSIWADGSMTALTREASRMTIHIEPTTADGLRTDLMTGPSLRPE